MNNNWLSVIALLISAYALGLAALNIAERSSPRPNVVVIDLPRITEDRVLALATSDLDDEELERKTGEWVRTLSQKFYEMAETHNLIILPRSIGVIGAPDITAAAIRELRADQEGQQ